MKLILPSLIFAACAACAVPASAAPRATCSTDESQLRGSFLTINDKGEFCEAGAHDQVAFEEQLAIETEQAEREAHIRAKAEYDAYRRMMLQTLRESGASPSEAAKLLAYAEQSAGISDPGRPAPTPAQEAARAASAPKPVMAPGTSQTLADCLKSTGNGAKCGMPQVTSKKMTSAGVIAF